MLLAVDVGNTQTVFALYEGAVRGESWRIATEAQRTGDELGALFADFLELETLTGVCLSSTVPQLITPYEQFVARFTSAELLVLAPGVRRDLTASRTRRSRSASDLDGDDPDLVRRRRLAPALPRRPCQTRRTGGTPAEWPTWAGQASSPELSRKICICAPMRSPVSAPTIPKFSTIS